MTFATRVNPKTGMRETYEVEKSSVDLERTRKELRDMIHGNHQWHTDPYAAPPAPAQEPEVVAEKSPKEEYWYDAFYGDAA